MFKRRLFNGRKTSLTSFALVLVCLFSFSLLLGCTGSDTFIISQAKLENLISNYSDLNYILFQEGYYDNNFLVIDGNIITVGVIDISSEDINWSQLINFPSGCLDNQAVKIIGNELVCVDVVVPQGMTQDFNLGENSFYVGSDEQGYDSLANAWGFNTAYIGELIIDVVNGYLWNNEGDIFVKNIYADSNVVVDGNVSANCVVLGDGNIYCASTDIGKPENTVYYIEGTGSVAGTWLGSHPDITSYYDGLKISYKIGVAGASTTTLNINDLGARQVYRATSNLTTHLPVNTVVYLTYTTVSGTGRWVWANYADGTESYAIRWNGSGVIAGETITQRKILMMASDGRFHPIVTGDSTSAGAKTVNTQPFVVNSSVLVNYSTTSYAENATVLSTNVYQAVAMGTNFAYNQNVVSGWTANKPVYLRGSIDGNGLFVLTGAGTSSGDYMTQDLPTSEDGNVYIMIGMMYTTTTSFRLFPSNTIIEFKDGKLQPYSPVTEPDLSPYVPYSGATQDVNLGFYNLDTNWVYTNVIWTDQNRGYGTMYCVDGNIVMGYIEGFSC